MAFSVGVLSVAVLGTLATFHFGLASANHGSAMSDADSYAKHLLEVMISENRPFATVALPAASTGYNDANGVQRPLDAAPFQGAMLPAGSRFQRHIEVRSCRTAADSSGSAVWKDELRQVSVTVFWTENGRSRSVTLRSYAKRPR